MCAAAGRASPFWFGPSDWSLYNQAVRRLVVMVAVALLAGAVLAGACEDDSLYKAGPSTFQNDTVDGAAGAGAAPGAAGASGDAGP